MIHEISIASNGVRTRFWWVCACGRKGKQKFFHGYAAKDGSDHLRDVK